MKERTGGGKEEGEAKEGWGVVAVRGAGVGRKGGVFDASSSDSFSAALSGRETLLREAAA